MRAIVMGTDRDVLERPSENRRRAVLEGACPKCAVSPFEVARCSTVGPASDDEDGCYIACGSCGAEVGEMRERVATIFGRDEDRAMLLEGRARVYGP